MAVTLQGPCPGECNRLARRADRIWAEVVRAVRYPTAREERLLGQLPPPVPGRPVWCADCADEIRRALSRLPDLAAALYVEGHPVMAGSGLHAVEDRAADGYSGVAVELLACGHSVPTHAPAAFARRCPKCLLDSHVGLGRLPAPTVSARRSASPEVSPSLSPSWDATDEITAWLIRTEWRLRRRLAGVSIPRPRDRTATRAAAYLTGHLSVLLALDSHPRGEVGRTVLRLADSAIRTAGLEDAQPMTVPCPICDVMSMDSLLGSDKVRCRRCRRSWSRAAFAALTTFAAGARQP